MPERETLPDQVTELLTRGGLEIDPDITRAATDRSCTEASIIKIGDITEKGIVVGFCRQNFLSALAVLFDEGKEGKGNTATTLYCPLQA